MPRPSYNDKIEALNQALQDVAFLSTDPRWNVTEYKALPLRLRYEAESARHVILISIRNRDEVQDGSIKRAVNIRAPEALVRSHWDNDHEIVIVTSVPPDSLVLKLRTSFRNEGIKADFVSAPFTGNIEYDYRHMARRVAAQGE